MTPVPITVVVPVYNAAPFVRRALESIASQTFRDFDAIVVDDGSKDASLAEIRACIGSDLRFRVITRENRGLVASCNEAVRASTTRYVFRMDADDVAHPDRFERQFRYLEENPSCVALGTRVLLADEELLPIIESFKAESHASIDAENLQGTGSAMCHPTVAMRREALEAAGGYRPEYEWAEDLDLFLRLAEVGRVANLPDVLLTYRQHLASVGYAKRLLQTERAAMAVSDARRRRGGSEQGARGGAAPTVPSQAYGSVAEIHRKWAWLSLIGGHPGTARKHAMRAIRLDPWNRANPRLAACAIRGR